MWIVYEYQCVSIMDKEYTGTKNIPRKEWIWLLATLVLSTTYIHDLEVIFHSFIHSFALTPSSTHSFKYITEACSIPSNVLSAGDGQN